MSMVNAVYYPNWRVYDYQFPSSFDLSTVSHVFYAFVHLDSDGNLYFNDRWADCEIPLGTQVTHGCLRSWTQIRKQKYPHLKIILSVGGALVDTFPTVLSDVKKIERFVESARKLLEENGLDGMDIDWEHPSCAEDGHRFLALLIRLRAALPSPTYLLTTALPAGTWALKHIPFPWVSNYVDFINLMAYDFVGPDFPGSNPVSGHHAQLYSPPRRLAPSTESRLSCDSAVTYLELKRGVPARKIVLGIPLYGRSFLGAKGLHQPFIGTAGRDSTFEYRELPRDGTEEVYDDRLGAAYCVGDECGFVSYDNKESVIAKAEFVKRRGLAGLFYWHIGSDKSGEDALVAVGYKSLDERMNST